MRRAWPWVLAAAVAACAIALSATPDAVERFAWHAAQPAVHTWLTAHFVHLGAVHLALNLVALLVLAAIAQRHALAGGMAAALGVSMLAVNLGLLVQAWPVGWYAGLSGALHGAFAWLCLRLAWETTGPPRMIALLLWLGGVMKVIVETHIPVGTMAPAGFPLALPAHLYGYAGGSVWAALCARLRKRK